MTRPRQFSAYVVTWSDVSSIPVGDVLIDKGIYWERVWNFFDRTSGDFTEALGRRLLRLCPDCRLDHKSIGALGHDGECGTAEVIAEAQAEIKHAKKRIEAK